MKNGGHSARHPHPDLVRDGFESAQPNREHGDEATFEVAYVSVVSLWEIATKLARGSALELEPLDAYFEVETLMEQGLVLIEVTLPHLEAYRRLPAPRVSHAAPFDRMLAAQARAEGLELLSADAKMGAYGVRRIW